MDKNEVSVVKRKRRLTEEEWAAKYENLVDPLYYTMDRMTYGGSFSHALSRIMHNPPNAYAHTNKERRPYVRKRKLVAA